MEKVFGPVITTVKELASDVLSLNLKVLLPKVKCPAIKNFFKFKHQREAKLAS